MQKFISVDTQCPADHTLFYLAIFPIPCYTVVAGPRQGRVYRKELIERSANNGIHNLRSPLKAKIKFDFLFN
jgi:hypothetical protein